MMRYLYAFDKFKGEPADLYFAWLAHRLRIEISCAIVRQDAKCGGISLARSSPTDMPAAAHTNANFH